MLLVSRATSVPGLNRLIIGYWSIVIAKKTLRPLSLVEFVPV